MNTEQLRGSNSLADRWGRKKWSHTLLLLLIPLVIAGCEEPYYAGRPAYGPGYAVAGPGPAVAVEIGDRPYYTRGAGYYVGPRYYAWRPGHWRFRHGRRVWVHGHYFVR
jgi:YXWGXW repeat-containing protein